MSNEVLTNPVVTVAVSLTSLNPGTLFYNHFDELAILTDEDTYVILEIGTQIEVDEGTLVETSKILQPGSTVTLKVKDDD